MSPTLWLEAKGMDARFRMERLWHTEGARSLSPNLRVRSAHMRQHDLQ